MANYNKVVYGYAEQVLNGKILASKYTQLACKRFFDDLDRAKDKGFYLDHAAGQFVLDVVQLMNFWKGSSARANIILEPHQQFHFYNQFGWKSTETGLRRFGKSYKEVARKNGKALCIETPIPTTKGWKRMADVVEGDFVFDELGQPCKVTFATDVMYNRKCYKVVFSDGSSIIADAEHLWYTESKRSGRNRMEVIKSRPRSEWGMKYEDKIKTTEQIKDTLLIENPSNTKKGCIEYNHKIPVCKSVKFPEKELPINPYWFGLWLGDGSSDAPMLAVGYNEIGFFPIFDRLEYDYRVYERKGCKMISFTSKKKRGPECIGAILKSLNVFKNKHIPELYLTSSIEQRMELLRGLMDTDGYVSKSGQCGLTIKQENFAYDALELISSLGFKATITKKQCKIGGVSKGFAFNIQFWAYQDTKLFYLDRKQVRLKEKPDSVTRTSFRQIVSVEEVKSVPVKCISVDSEKHLYLAGRNYIPTHNTTECATKGLIATKFLNVAGAQVYSVATKEEQAKIVFSDAANIIKATKSMYSEKRKLFKIFAKSIVDESSNSFFRPLGSDSDTQDGFDPYYAIIDEYHAHTNDKMLNVIESGMGARPDPMVDIITTAGFNREGPCAKFRQIITNILDGVIENESIFGIIYTIDNESDWQDLEKVPMANPNYGVSVYPDYFKKRLLEAQQQGDEKEVDYKTKNLNIWTDSAQVWIQDEIWMQAADMIEIPNGSICYGGLDVAVTEDLTSFSLHFPIGEKVYWKQWAWTHEEKYKELQRIGISSVVEWKKRGILKVCDGNTIDLDEVFDFIMELYSQYQIQAIAADRAYSGNMLNALNKEGVPTYEFSQSPKNLTQYIRQVSTSIKSKTLHHGGDPLLRWMASNAQVVVSGNNLMITKQKGNKNSKIDGVMSGIFATACHALVPLLGKSEPTVEVW